MMRFLCVFMVFLFVAQPAWAQGALQLEESRDIKQKNYRNTPYRTSPVKMRRDKDLPPIEPEIPAVTYLKQKPPYGLQHRVESLLHSVYMDVPPEYDHYGYEIRRYMAHIAGPNVLGNKEALQGQINNIKNAEIVLSYWRRALNKEIKEIEVEIEAANTLSSVRSIFKYNKGVVYAFLTECQQWTKHNKAMLEYLVEIDGGYQYQDPEFMFVNNEYRRKFVSLYKAKKAAYEQLVEYAPFRMMIY